MRIRCPSPSNSVILLPPQNPPNHSKPKLRSTKPRKKVAYPTKPTPAAPPVRKSSSSRRREQIPGKPKRTDSASLAAKKEQLRIDTKVKTDGKCKESPKRPYSFVYAGNLQPTITEERLKDVFSACGPVLRIIIRCSRGHVIRVLPEGVRPELFFGPRDRKYASIEFKDSMAYLKALQLNGRWLDGAQMIVCASAADLPEAKEASRGATAAPSSPARPPRPTITQNAFASPLPVNKNPYSRTTEPVTPIMKLPRPTKPPETPTTSEGDRFRFLGLSFAKCII